MSRNFKFGWSCDFEDDSKFFTHINDIPEDEPCALHSCLTAVADLFDRLVYYGPKVPEGTFGWDDDCNEEKMLIHEDDCRRYAEEHHLIFELNTDDDFNCIAVYIADGDWIIGVCSDREVELYEEDKAKKKAFVESVMSQLEEQAGHKVSMSQDELVAKLVETQDRNEELEEENDALKEALEAKEQELETTIQERAFYHAQFSAIDKSFDELQQENFELQEALQLTEQDLDKALYQLNGFKASDAYFKSRMEEVERLKKENSDMGMQVLRANAKKNDMERAYKELFEKTCDYDYLLKENASLKKENEEYRCENVLLQHHVESITSQIAELEKEVHRVTKIIKANKHSA